MNHISSEAILEKNESVLWTLTLSGAVLNNTLTNTFIELTQEGYLAWCLADGCTKISEIAEEVSKSYKAGTTVADANKDATLILQQLSDLGFLRARVEEAQKCQI